MFYLFNKSRFIGIKLCKPTEKYNITILHGEEEQKILGRIYQLRKCFPSFYDEKQRGQNSLPINTRTFSFLPRRIRVYALTLISIG